MGDMNDRKLFSVGAGGTAITLICCFTPLLVVTLGLAGLSAVVGWLDFVLLPMLAVFVALTAFAGWKLWMRKQARSS
jgi:mercuric ion transport protein